jgi:glycosyltransferase involved in cell wall biosynthesis
MKNQLRIGYISIGDSNDANTWSGTTYYFAKNLERFVELERISLENNFFIKLIFKYYSLKSKILKKRYMANRSKLVSKYYSKKAKEAISRIGNLDAIISVGTIPIAYLDVDIPIINYTDATFNQMINYYEEFSNLSDQTIKNGNELEKKALEKCDLLFYCSDWARNSAIRDYQIDPSKVYSVPFGLNMDEVPDKADVLRSVEEKIHINRCNLIFVGKDFKRKGGDLAYKTLCYLNEQLNTDAHLTIVGSNPNIKDNRVTIIPYINKNNKKEQELYQKILKESHFLILPTRADCFSMVGIEANAYGIPVITTNTGGLTSLIDNGINGFTMELHDKQDIYALKIYEYFINKDRYRDLCLNSRNHYEEKTNWINTCSYIVDKIKSHLRL